MNADPFESFLEHLEVSGVALPADFEGCTTSEIDAIEDKYGVRLPAVYKRFLRSMGHQCGFLFVAEQVRVDYYAVLDLTEELRAALATQNPELAEKLPPDAFFILTTGDDLDFFIRCEEGDDPPVYQMNTPKRTIEVVYGSVTEWLEAGCVTAEETMAEGHFEGMARKYESPRAARPTSPAEPLPYALLCPGCGKRLVFAEPSMEHSRFLDYGFLYNDEGTLALVWKWFDPAYVAMFGNQRPWYLSAAQQAVFEARLKPAPTGGRWRFQNYPRCPHCKAAVSLPMTKGETCLVYAGSLVLNEAGAGRGLKQVLVEGAATAVTAPPPRRPAGHLEVPCSGCGAQTAFGPPSTEDARLQNLAFLYDDAGTATLVWAVTDPAFREMFGNVKPWALSAEQQAAFEASLKPPPAGGHWRFANSARCPRCRTIISPPMTQCELCLVYPQSLLVQDWISGSSLRRVLLMQGR